ncbi:type VII secretion-associated protein [Nocardia carnea]|uniref:type VII secretion-associated protein n=1 Tax=Nocardia carnea TaxID=37328 RepID=UPI00245656D3|nr:type VII secretion-associated protein [Nocardia carnea]
MPAVEIALTETRLWAWSANTHADLVPSVVPGSDGRTLVVGEPLTPPSIAVSPAQLITADRIAYDPGMPKPVDALATVFGHTLTQLRIPSPCERLTVVHPSEWDPHRLAVLHSAAARHAGRVELQPAALRAVVATQRMRDVRSVVLEFGPLSTTASTVVPGDRGPRLEFCEHQPLLAAVEISAGEPGRTAFRSMIERLIHGCQVDSVVIVGRTDADFLNLVAEVVAELCNAELLVLGGADLVRARNTDPIDQRPSLPPAAADAEWLQPLRERAAATRPPRSKTPLYIGAAAVMALAVLVAGGVFLGMSSGADSEAVASTPTTTGAPEDSEEPAEPAPGAGSMTVGPITFTVPEGWRVTNPTTASTDRVVLEPTQGLKARITVIQEQLLVPGAGYEQVAADLEAKRATAAPGLYSPIRRDVVFGGRSGLAYSEHPEGGSTVDWHVIVEHSIQISIGCQYQTGGQDSITPICEDLASSLDITR